MCDVQVTIRFRIASSLNVVAAASILLYEARRRAALTGQDPEPSARRPG